MDDLSSPTDAEHVLLRRCLHRLIKTTTPDEQGKIQVYDGADDVLRMLISLARTSEQRSVYITNNLDALSCLSRLLREKGRCSVLAASLLWTLATFKDNRQKIATAPRMLESMLYLLRTGAQSAQNLAGHQLRVAFSCLICLSTHRQCRQMMHACEGLLQAVAKIISFGCVHGSGFHDRLPHSQGFRLEIPLNLDGSAKHITSLRTEEIVPEAFPRRPGQHVPGTTRAAGLELLWRLMLNNHDHRHAVASLDGLLQAFPALIAQGLGAQFEETAILFLLELSADDTTMKQALGNTFDMIRSVARLIDISSTIKVKVSACAMLANLAKLEEFRGRIGLEKNLYFGAAKLLRLEDFYAPGSHGPRYLITLLRRILISAQAAQEAASQHEFVSILATVFGTRFRMQEERDFDGSLPCMCAETLWLLAWHSTTARSIIAQQKGVLSSLIITLSRGGESGKEVAAGTLWNLSFQNPTNKMAIAISKGALPKLVELSHDASKPAGDQPPGAASQDEEASQPEDLVQVRASAILRDLGKNKLVSGVISTLRTEEKPLEDEGILDLLLPPPWTRNDAVLYQHQLQRYQGMLSRRVKLHRAFQEHEDLFPPVFTNTDPQLTKPQSFRHKEASSDKAPQWSSFRTPTRPEKSLKPMTAPSPGPRSRSLFDATIITGNSTAEFGGLRVPGSEFDLKAARLYFAQQVAPTSVTPDPTTPRGPSPFPASEATPTMDWMMHLQKDITAIAPDESDSHDGSTDPESEDGDPIVSADFILPETADAAELVFGA